MLLKIKFAILVRIYRYHGMLEILREAPPLVLKKQCCWPRW